ncbi:MAG: bifunctional phosphoribosylaminoimidazolecarboxamide formyltransferase/IMP cyclohydrolase [Actinomycetia bacterium]|nr:bifunctional phosphoribosylaminoimidazolecarboxamide formyltransferase/IMP cyclohydrolase [Actinomycetes bacterium]
MSAKIRRALISVSNKQGLADFATSLQRHGVEIYSTGGTFKYLVKHGISVKKVEEITGFAEMLDGRVKTLHPYIHGALLADRNNSDHMKQAEDLKLKLIDMVVVNLYPFKETVSRPGVSLAEAVENIDIGGPTMIRSAAKNYKSVAVVVNPVDYNSIISEMDSRGGSIGEDTLFKLCTKAFSHTYRYDGVISNYFSRLGTKYTAEFRDSEGNYGDRVDISLEKIQDLRYGENPHQRSAYYRYQDSRKDSLVNAEKLQGKELSYNNILDGNAAFAIVREFPEICVSVIKHNNPCGAAIGDSVSQAYQRAYSTDPVSAFGSVVASNHIWTLQAGEFIADKYVEVLIAPGFEPQALELLKEKENLRILKVDFNLDRYLGDLNKGMVSPVDIKSVDGGMLLQDWDAGIEGREEMKVVSRVEPTDSQWQDLLFGWQIVKSVKSNAIVLASERKTVGIGAGQMSRVDSVRIAIDKSLGKASGTCLASDAFFPFSDAVTMAAEAGIKAIIQPGGSVRDQEVIEACNEHNVAMVFTGRRHFRH